MDNMFNGYPIRLIYYNIVRSKKYTNSSSGVYCYL